MKTKQPKNPRRAKGLDVGKNSVAGIQPPQQGQEFGMIRVRFSHGPEAFRWMPPALAPDFARRAVAVMERRGLEHYDRRHEMPEQGGLNNLRREMNIAFICRGLRAMSEGGAR